MEQEQKNISNKDRGVRTRRKNAIIGLAIATGILGATTVGLGVAYGISMSQATSYSLKLENIYKKNGI